MCHAAMMPPLREVRWVIYIWSFGKKNKSVILNLPAEAGLIQNLAYCRGVVMWCDDVLMQRWCLPWGRSSGWLTFDHLVRKIKVSFWTCQRKQAWFRIWLIAEELWCDVMWWCAHAAMMPPLREVRWVICIRLFGKGQVEDYIWMMQ